MLDYGDTYPEGSREGTSLACIQVIHSINSRTMKVILTIISVLCYRRSHHSNLLPKILAVYLKFRGLSARGFDMLHALGLIMSHKWACDVVDHMSDRAKDEVIKMMEEFPWVISYDNVNIPFKVFSQRIDNQSQLGHGTAATVYLHRDAEMLSEGMNELLKKQRAEGIKNPLTAIDIMKLEMAAHARVEEQMKYIVLRMLLDSPLFNSKTYSEKDSPSLAPPTPVDPLPTGPDHITLQYLLGTVDIPEASYEDNSRLVNEWLGQLGFNTMAEKVKLATKKIVTWVRDQLTVDRLRRLFGFRSDEDNSYDRLDFSNYIFGWLHAEMANVNSLHKQYLGTKKGHGLAQAFELLNKKKLTNVRTQGPFHNDLVEAVYEIAEAHFREDWLKVGGVDSLDELRSCSAVQLKEMADKIVDTRASAGALDSIDSSPHPDPRHRQVVMWSRDVLHFIVLDRAVKEGDVGLMEKLLPTLLFRFIGGGNGKYALEILEVMQGLYREWPKEVA